MMGRIMVVIVMTLKKAMKTMQVRRTSYRQIPAEALRRFDIFWRLRLCCARLSELGSAIDAAHKGTVRDRVG
jgi:hypothetical protein